MLTADPIDLGENFLETDEEVKSEVDKALSGMTAYHEKLKKRVSLMKLIHEDLIIVAKIDVVALKTFLHLTEQTRFERSRQSYYGSVLAISPVPSGDEIKEYKKSLIAVDEIVNFNPDSAYSMNVIVPEEHPEIWCLSIDNLLVGDMGFDPVKAKMKTVEAEVILQRVRRAQQAEKMRQATDDLTRKMKSNPKVTL